MSTSPKLNVATNPAGPVGLRPRTSGLALSSMILGLLSLPLIFVCIGFVTAILAIILGAVALGGMVKGPKHIKGKGFAITGIISAVAAMIIYGIFVASMTEKNELKAEVPGQAALTLAEQKIYSDRDGISYGNSPAAIALAEKFSITLDLLQDEYFEREGKEPLFQISGGQFIVYCLLDDDSIVFLVHVPEYRHYEGDAKGTLSEIAWFGANDVLQDRSEAQGSTLVIGLKGSLLYGDIMKGETGEAQPMDTGLDQEALLPFFAEEQVRMKDATEAPLEAVDGTNEDA